MGRFLTNAVPLLKKLLKPAILLAIFGMVVYRVHFAPVAVDLTVAALGPITSEVMGTGTLEARVQATISAKIAGRIAQVLVDQGERVTKGQLLATLDDGDLRQQVEVAKADLEVAKASVDRAVAEITSADAIAVESRISYTRAVKLVPAKAISTADVDRATQLHNVAEAALRRSQLAKVELERQVIKSQESLRYYQERLADSTITAPFDGLVLRRSRESGDIVVPGSEILQLISTEEMWISAWVDETAMAALAVNQVARVVFRSEPDKAYTGILSRMAPLTDRETREFLVDLTLKELPKTWAVGQRAEVYIQTSKKDQALLVPQRMIVWQNGRPGLFLKKSGHAVWRGVTLGLRGSESVEVTENLAPGDEVISVHDPKGSPLTEGQSVSPVKK